MGACRKLKTVRSTVLKFGELLGIAEVRKMLGFGVHNSDGLTTRWPLTFFLASLCHSTRPRLGAEGSSNFHRTLGLVGRSAVYILVMIGVST